MDFEDGEREWADRTKRRRGSFLAMVLIVVMRSIRRENVNSADV
jgi:hypothetical protein